MTDQIERLHAACDECRTRKLKCSGGTPHCIRCARESICCVYSPQKQMGRPRKRRQDEASAPIEQRRVNVSETISFNVVEPTFNNYEISTPQLNDFSGHTDFQGHNGSVANVSVLHDDSALANVFGNEHNHFDFSMDPAIDPSLWNAQPNGADSESTLTPAPIQQDLPCTCLSAMYLAISDLQTMSSFAFPAVIVPLRRALTTASTLLNCEKCPKEPFTAIQNVQSLSALLSALAERFHKVLNEVEAEAGRLENIHGKKLFRVSENNLATVHLHTADGNCPMGFDIELEGKDWRRLVKKAVRTEVLGGGSNPVPLKLMLDLFEQRQRRWHTHYAHMPQLDLRIKMFGAQNVCAANGSDATCLRLVASVREMIDNMRWD